MFSCSNDDSEKIPLMDNPIDSNSDYNRSYFTFTPPFKPSMLPKFEGKTQFYGMLYHINEKYVNFAIDILGDYALLYVDTNMNEQLSDHKGELLLKQFTIEISPFKDSKIKVRFNASNFIESNFLDPFLEYQIQNKKLAQIKLGDIEYNFILIDLQNNGFSDIAKDKILLENSVQLRTLDIDSNFGSYLKSHEKTYEFIISNDLDYIKIKEKLN